MSPRELVDVHLHDRTILRLRGMDELRALLDRSLDSPRAGLDCWATSSVQLREAGAQGDPEPTVWVKKRVRFLDRDAIVLVIDLPATDRLAHAEVIAA